MKYLRLYKYVCENGASFPEKADYKECKYIVERDYFKWMQFKKLISIFNMYINKKVANNYKACVIMSI